MAMHSLGENKQGKNGGVGSKGEHYNLLDSTIRNGHFGGQPLLLN